MSGFTETVLQNKEVIFGLLGGAGGYIAGLFQSIGKLKTDLAFIKGQLSQIMKMAETVDKLKQRHVILSKDHEKTRSDVDAAHEAVRTLRKTILIGRQ